MNLWPTYVMFCLYNITNKQKKYYLDNNMDAEVHIDQIYLVIVFLHY